jgi:hypothetical protein
MVGGDAGRVTPSAAKCDRRWDAELERRGVAAVAAALASAGIGRGAEFCLFVPDLPNPSRGYVEDGAASASRERGKQPGNSAVSGSNTASAELSVTQAV